MSVPPAFLSSLEIRLFLVMAGWTVLAYDHFLTFDLEVDYIWRAPWSTVKAIFLLNRYGTLIGQSLLMVEEWGVLTHGSRKFCANFLWLQSLLVLILSETTRALLLLRARALWRCSYRVAVSVVSVYVIYVMLRCGYTSYVTFKNYDHFRFQYLEETKLCILTGAVSSVWYSGVTSIVLDSGMFAVIAYYLYKLCKEVQQFRYSPLLRLLVRDAVLFYLVNVFHDVLGIVSLTVFLHQPLYLSQVVFSYPLLTVAGQRAVLNLRGFQSKPYSTQDISRSVDRQLAAMQRRTFWQSVVDPWMGDLHREMEMEMEMGDGGDVYEEPRVSASRYRAVRTIELGVVEEARGSYELGVIRSHRNYGV